MIRNRGPSIQAISVLSLLAQSHPEWQHGYELTQISGVKSGTLYPLLMRLEQQSFVEAAWQESPLGRPPRHVYRLTALGLQMLADEDAANSAKQSAKAATNSTGKKSFGAA
jgi:PadR family transcriptional regulator, regulatory protein PadR